MSALTPGEGRSSPGSETRPLHHASPSLPCLTIGPRSGMVCIPTRGRRTTRHRHHSFVPVVNSPCRNVLTHAALGPKHPGWVASSMRYNTLSAQTLRTAMHALCMNSKSRSYDHGLFQTAAFSLQTLRELSYILMLVVKGPAHDWAAGAQSVCIIIHVLSHPLYFGRIITRFK